MATQMLNHSDPQVRLAAQYVQLPFPGTKLGLAEKISKVLAKWSTSSTQQQEIEALFTQTQSGRAQEPTFDDIRTFLHQTNILLLNVFHREYFGHIAQDVAFGMNKISPYYIGYTRSRLQDDLGSALYLTNIIVELEKINLEAGEKTVTKEEVEEVIQKPEEEDVTAGIPIILGSEKKKKEEEKEKEEEEEEDEEKKKKKPPGEPDKELLDRAIQDSKLGYAYKIEAERMRRMILSGIANAYGITDFNRFEQMFRGPYDSITPFVLFELQKLQPGRLKDVGLRAQLYRDILIRIQAQGVFRQRFIEAWDTLSKKTFESKEQRKARLLALEKDQGITPENLSAIISQNHETEQSDIQFKKELEDIASYNEASSRAHFNETLEENLRTLLTQSGVYESDINGVLLRLKSFAFTKKNVDSMSNEDFEKLFGGVLQGYAFQNVIRLAQQQENGAFFSWSHVFRQYVRAQRQHIYQLTKKNSALFLDSRAQVSDEVTRANERAIQSYSLESVVLGTYEHAQDLQNRQDTGDQKTYQNARTYRQELNHRIQAFMHFTPGQQRGAALGYGLIPELSYSAEIFSQLHVQETQTYLINIINFGFGGDFTADGFNPDAFFLNDIFDGRFISPSDGSFLDGGEIWGSAQGFLGESTRKAEVQLGKWGLTLAASIIEPVGGSVAVGEALEMIEGLYNIPIIGPLIQQMVEKNLESIGKLMLALMGLIASIFFFTGLVGFALGVMAGMVQDFLTKQLSGLLRNVQLKSLGRNALQGLQSFAGSGVGAALSNAWGLVSPLGAAPGVGVAVTTVGILGGVTAWQFFNQQNQTTPFLTVRQEVQNVSYGKGVDSPGCFPVTGTITTLDFYPPSPPLYPLPRPHGVYHSCITGLSGTDVCPRYGGINQAIDIGTASEHPPNPPIYAPYAGKAFFYSEGSGYDQEVCNDPTHTKCEPTGYGNHVILTSTIEGHDAVFIFGHLQDFGDHQAGEAVEVSVGEILGLVDSTGGSTGNHLHYEVLGFWKIQDVLPHSVKANERVISSCAPEGNPSL